MRKSLGRSLSTITPTSSPALIVAGSQGEVNQSCSPSGPAHEMKCVPYPATQDHGTLYARTAFPSNSLGGLQLTPIAKEMSRPKPK